MKQCSRCKKILTDEDFNKLKSTGLQSYCKECQKEQYKKYYYKNREKLKEKRRKYHREHQVEENKKARIRANKYYQENKEEILEKMKIYKKCPETKEKTKEYKKRWRLKNPDYHKNYRKNNIELCKELEKRWRTRNKEHIRKRMKAYRQSERGKLIKKQWYENNPDKVKLMLSHKWAKRREMGFIPLMVNPFPKELKVTYHHLNDKPGLLIPLPTVIHSNIPSYPVKLHRKLADGWIKKLYCIDIDALIKHCQSRQVDNTFK